ncbi:methyltransferase [Thalassoglobus sp. JC818]|uniref:class I SAM-dependent methyltransferase n=1 Tax=Thalassoglobus sp. JC818 TaxID=3232136 RepID=UPI003457ACE7
MERQNEHEESGDQPSAFPRLSADLQSLPEIPGGWQDREFDVSGTTLKVLCPAQPDLFLDDDEVLKANEQNDYTPYWAFLWPSSITMSLLISQAPWTPGTQVLELGSGIGLVGLAGLARGDRVTFSDYDPTSLHLCRMNAVRNGFSDPATLQLDWREPTAQQFDAIVGCEVTYDAPSHGVILNLLSFMLSENGVCWLGDPGRYQSERFYQMAQSEGFSVRVLDTELNELKQPKSNGFQIMELRRSST